MSIIILLLPLALFLALTFVIAFIWATGRGQYDDLETPAHKMLLDDSLVNARSTVAKAPRGTIERIGK